MFFYFVKHLSQENVTELYVHTEHIITDILRMAETEEKLTYSIKSIY